VIDLYVADDDASGLGLLELVSRAARRNQQGDHRGAVRDGFTALRQVQAREQDYTRALAVLREAFQALSRPREALSIAWYLGDFDGARRLQPHVPAADHARTLIAEAERGPGALAQAAAAGALLEVEQTFVRAAIAYELARESGKARTLWSRLAQRIPRSERPEDLYAAGLAEFNVFRTSADMNDEARAKASVSAAVHLLEEAADRFESTGNREGAFYCFKVLGALGDRTHVFEHVLAGAVNVLRILAEDHLRQYALQTYEEAIAAADRAGETLAAATLAHEMAAYAAKQGETAVAESAMVKEAELFQRAAEALAQRGAPVAMTENALISAILVLSELGQYTRVRQVYERLATLPFEPKRREHYLRASARYAGARDERLALQANESGREPSAFPDVWHVDLLEWEAKGSAALATADVLLAPKRYGEITRRRALAAHLVALSFEASAADGTNDRQPMRAALLLVEMLAPLELYGILSPLERLAQRREPEVRAAALRTLGRFPFKRTLGALRVGSEDPVAAVSREACRAIENVRVAVAFDPLARMYRESLVPEARHAALRALARLELLEASELVLGVLAYGTAADKQIAKEALKQGRARVFLEAARSVLADASSPAHGAVREIVAARGIGA